MTACSKKQDTLTVEKPAQLTPVTINQAFEHLLYIGLYVAKDAGFFEKQGLDVKIETGGGDAQAFAALTSGSAQFAQGDPAFVAIAEEKGWDGRVVTMAVDRVAIWGVTFDKSIKPFTNPSGFKGRTVATYPEPNTSYVVQKQLAQKAGLKLDVDTKILQVPFGTELATLKNKQADIAQTIEPNVSQVALQGGSVVFSYPDAWGPLAFTGVMTSQALIEKNPELVQKVVTAYEEAFQFIQNDFEGALKIAQKRLPNLPPDVVRAALRRLVDSGSIPKHAMVNPESWRKLLEIRVDVGDLKAMPSKELFDNSFAQKARQGKQKP
ncbi:MAG: ABC transporter substrate-binding protein [Desulfobulbaceae bacterium]|nr:ABC transporter substrate-binding protein [Desulfobulbaceae bacterium]